MPNIKLFGHLRKLAGYKELQVTGANLHAVLERMIEQFPALDGAVIEKGQIRPHYVITVNGNIVTDLDIPLMENDVVAVFPPLAGG